MLVLVFVSLALDKPKVLCLYATSNTLFVEVAYAVNQQEMLLILLLVTNILMVFLVHLLGVVRGQRPLIEQESLVLAVIQSFEALIRVDACRHGSLNLNLTI